MAGPPAAGGSTVEADRLSQRSPLERIRGSHRRGKSVRKRIEAEEERLAVALLEGVDQRPPTASTSVLAAATGRTRIASSIVTLASRSAHDRMRPIPVHDVGCRGPSTSSGTSVGTWLTSTNRPLPAWAGSRCRPPHVEAFHPALVSVRLATSSFTWDRCCCQPGTCSREGPPHRSPVKLEVRKPDAYQGGMEGFDVVVVDSVSPPKLGNGRSCSSTPCPPTCRSRCWAGSTTPPS